VPRFTALIQSPQFNFQFFCPWVQLRSFTVCCITIVALCLKNNAKSRITENNAKRKSTIKAVIPTSSILCGWPQKLDVLYKNASLEKSASSVQGVNNLIKEVYFLRCNFLGVI